jgi:allantoin racemase
MRICCQLPVTLPSNDPKTDPYLAQLQKHYARVKRPDTEVVLRDVAGVVWESAWEQYNGLRAFNNIEILKSVIGAEKEGYDAVSIGCFFDPVLFEARQLLKIPVTALAESSMYLASLMGSKFAIITKDKLYVRPMEAQIPRYGMEAKAIRHNPVRVLTMPEEQMSSIERGIFTGASQDVSPMVDNFKEIARGCIEDGAEVLIMGCGLLSPVLMQAGLVEVDGAALVEPDQASLKLAEVLVDLHKAGIPFVSRKSTYVEVPSQYISDVLASRS